MDSKSEGECNPLTKTDYLGNGLKCRKRFKVSKLVDHRGIERESRSRHPFQRHESESSSSSDGNNKKLRLEEEEALWNEAVLSIPLRDNSDLMLNAPTSNVLAVNEDPKKEASSVVSHVADSSPLGGIQ